MPLRLINTGSILGPAASIHALSFMTSVIAFLAECGNGWCVCVSVCDVSVLWLNT